jgi:small subunit ribosomal protein S4
LKTLESKSKLEVPPGGIKGERRARVSGYGLQLREKQKLRRMYGILERQFHGYYVQAAGRPGATGETLLQILESRLDNVVYRMGFAATRNEARQLVSHRSVTVNGASVNVPSYQCKAGDVIALRDKTQKQARVQQALQIRAQVGFPDWVEVDEKKFSGVLKALPERGEILPDINESLVVELYSK